MAVEFNVTSADKFFLGEDKAIDFTIFGQDGVTPLDMSGLPLIWNLSKTNKDPAIFTKDITAGGASTGLTIVGTFNIVPAANTQRVRATFASADTDPVVTAVLEVNPYTLKAGVAYRHSLKRQDAGNEGILSYGSFTFLQAVG